MNRWLPALYKKRGLQKNIPLSVIDNSIQIAEYLYTKNLPIILSLGHLAFHTDISYKIYRSIIKRKNYAYHDFKMRKRCGGFRTISVPNTKLLLTQRWIDRNILTKLSKSPYSYAFEKGQKIEDCASSHLGCKWLIKIDLRHFFESISEIQVYHVFKKLGYTELVSFELARLCTKTYKKSSIKYRNNYWQTGWKKYEFYFDKRVGHLPQGAPTSPRLANAVVFDLDSDIADVLNNTTIIYTRYADDLIFSTSDSNFSKKEAKSIVNKIFRILPKYGLMPHPQKVQIVPPGSRKIVLGLLVDTDKIRLTKDFRNRLECHLYYCYKDANGHAIRRGFRSVLGLKNYINGLLAHVKNIDEEYYNKLCKRNLIPNWPI